MRAPLSRAAFYMSLMGVCMQTEVGKKAWDAPKLKGLSVQRTLGGNEEEFDETFDIFVNNEFFDDYGAS